MSEHMYKTLNERHIFYTFLTDLWRFWQLSNAINPHSGIRTAQQNRNEVEILDYRLLQ